MRLLFSKYIVFSTYLLLNVEFIFRSLFQTKRLIFLCNTSDFTNTYFTNTSFQNCPTPCLKYIKRKRRNPLSAKYFLHNVVSTKSLRITQIFPRVSQSQNQRYTIIGFYSGIGVTFKILTETKETLYLLKVRFCQKVLNFLAIFSHQKSNFQVLENKMLVKTKTSVSYDKNAPL